MPSQWITSKFSRRWRRVFINPLWKKTHTHIYIYIIYILKLVEILNASALDGFQILKKMKEGL